MVSRYWLSQLNRDLKIQDPYLYAVMEGSKVCVYRKAKNGIRGLVEEHDRLDRPAHFILALTDTWKKIGKPKAWGIVPVLDQLQFMDWGSREVYWERRKQRERAEEQKRISQHHNLRAIAADCRRDFAKATNDINTSIVEKKDRRRLKGA